MYTLTTITAAVAAPTLEEIKPWWLIVVLRCKYTSVEKNQNNDKPVEPLRLDHFPTLFSTSFI